MDIEAKRATRLELLLKLYELSGGAKHKKLDLKAVGRDMGLDEETVLNAGEYLKDQHLIEYMSFGPTVGLTHSGIKEAEERLHRPDVGSDRFPPMNIIHVGQMVGSTIQQGTIQSSIHSQTQIDTTAAKALVAALEKAIAEAELSPEARAEADADVATVKAQAASSNPKRGIMKAALDSLGAVAKGGGHLVTIGKVVKDLLALVQ